MAENDETTYKNIHIKIIPDKLTQIKINHYKFMFFDIAQFYDKMKLDTAGEKILGIRKIKYDVTDLKAEKYFNNKKYKKELDYYLQRDTDITYKLIEHLIKIASKFIIPKYFYSQASFSQQYFLENMKRDYILPSKKILQFALNSYNGGRFEVMKRGTYNNVNLYDIRSAYPYQNINIPAMDKGEWINNKKYENKALISLFKILIEGESIISPIKAENNNMIYYPIGKKKSYINKAEYKTLKKYGYKIKILNAYHYFDDKPEYPYLFLKKFYEEKEKVGKKHPEYMFYKIIINGFYGKTIQLQKKEYVTEEEGEEINIKIKNGKMRLMKKKYKAGLLFNPIIAQEITGNTRSMLLDAVVNIQEKIIAFATDSIITTAVPNIKIGRNLGEWDEEKHKNVFTSIGSGIYFFHGDKMKFRGFGKGYEPEEILNSETNIVNMKIQRAIKLKQTFKSIKKDLNEFNIIKKVDKSLNLNFDKKREWDDEFNNTNEIYCKQINSKPLKVKEW